MASMWSYVVRQDTGLAPNPFHGVMTLALCTPNHQRLGADCGDWIIGNAPKADGNKIVFAMCISERIGLTQYFHDPRFEAKKPRYTGNWRDWQLGVGDNIYYQDEHGTWRQGDTRFHCDDDDLFRKDTEGDTVFVADEEFYYLGEKMCLVPAQLRGVLQVRQGCKPVSPELVAPFIEWVRSQFELRCVKRPRHRKDAAQRY